jgi:hypothetical protein
MAHLTLLQNHPPRNGQSGRDTGWPEEEEFFDTVAYEDDLLGPDDWEDEDEDIDIDDWEETDDYDWDDEDDDDDWDDDDYDEDDDL